MNFLWSNSDSVCVEHVAYLELTFLVFHRLVLSLGQSIALT